MGKAVPCKQCKTDSHLRFREDSAIGIFWVNCERCGANGPSKMSPAEAGMEWNRANSTEPLFYLQNNGAGYVGNSPMFWHQSNSGYTPIIAESKRMTMEECEQIINSSRGTHSWTPWPVEDVEAAAITVCDSQKLPARK